MLAVIVFRKKNRLRRDSWRHSCLPESDAHTRSPCPQAASTSGCSGPIQLARTFSARRCRPLPDSPPLSKNISLALAGPDAYSIRRFSTHSSCALRRLIVHSPDPCFLPSQIQDFYGNERCRTWFKAYIATLVNRKNTVTGVVYRDDPTIFSWQLIKCASAQPFPLSSVCASATCSPRA